jgi:benzoyl-CoA reductase subunit D
MELAFMIAIGIDSGSQNTKAVAVEDGEILGLAAVPTGFEIEPAAKRALEQLLESISAKASEVAAISATGIGRKQIGFAGGEVNEVISAAKGARHVMPGCRVVIDIGAESSRAVYLNENGAIRNYEVNDKCASGGGLFIETAARALEIATEDMGDYSMRHTKAIPMNAQCVVFVESEVISLIHRLETVENIAHGIHAGLAGRVCSMVRRFEINGGVAFIGGAANNSGLVACIEDALGSSVFVPENPGYVSALGAALHAAELCS